MGNNNKRELISFCVKTLENASGAPSSMCLNFELETLTRERVRSFWAMTAQRSALATFGVLNAPKKGISLVGYGCKCKNSGNKDIKVLTYSTVLNMFSH